MPITGISSYGPTIEEFRFHWEHVNGSLPTLALKLPGNYTLQNFISDQIQVTQNMTFVSDFTEDARIAAAKLLLKKEAVRVRIGEFRLAVQLNLSGSQFGKSAPAQPQSGAIQSKFMKPVEDVIQVWMRIDGMSDIAGFTPPLLLRGGYTRQQFAADVTALETAFKEWTTADTKATLQRAQRDALLPPIYERMKQYRIAVQLFLPANSPLLQTVPRLSPFPGSTPPGVQVLGMWNDTLSKATFSWEQSSFAHIDKIQVRGCTGGTYKANEEEIVADLLPTATTFETDWGLTAPGSIATFKFYVMATTGNENGGKAVKIVRPTG